MRIAKCNAGFISDHPALGGFGNLTLKKLKDVNVPTLLTLLNSPQAEFNWVNLTG